MKPTMSRPRGRQHFHHVFKKTPRSLIAGPLSDAKMPPSTIHMSRGLIVAKNRSRLALAGLAAATALALTACGGAPATAERADGVKLINADKLTVCTHLAFKPFQFKDDSGKIVGFDVDLMDLVAKDLGVTQEVVDIQFEQITTGSVFAAKKCDAGAAGITILPERAQVATFSQPYYDSMLALMVKADSGITSLADLKDKQVAVQVETTGKEWAQANQAEYGYVLREFDDNPSASNSVLGGVTVGTINDNGVLGDFATQNPSLKVVAEFGSGEQYGFNVGNDNKALAEVINTTLTKAKADGTYNEIYKKWFGVDAPK